MSIGHPQVAAKVDRKTFNYGRALGVPPITSPDVNPWERMDAGTKYRAIEAAARAMTAAQMQLSGAAWALDMALKKVRDAETVEEQEAAMADAVTEYFARDAATECLGTTLRWFRFGRVCQHVR